jgi:hypothetical protein
VQLPKAVVAQVGHAVDVNGPQRPREALHEGRIVACAAWVARYDQGLQLGSPCAFKTAGSL